MIITSWRDFPGWWSLQRQALEFGYRHEVLLFTTVRFERTDPWFVRTPSKSHEGQPDVWDSSLLAPRFQEFFQKTPIRTIGTCLIPPMPPLYYILIITLVDASRCKYGKKYLAIIITSWRDSSGWWNSQWTWFLWLVEFTVFGFRV